VSQVGPRAPASRPAARRLGLFGGTFDPPHFGHLAAAQEAAELLGLDRVLFLPAGRPPHKPSTPLSPLEDRLKMVELAIHGDPRFELSTADCEQAGLSYTADLLARLRGELGSAVELFFLVGMDSLHDLKSWHEPARVLEQCVLVAVSRPGQLPWDAQELEVDLPAVASRVITLHTPGVAISSSELRARVAAGRSIRYLVPDSVIALILRRGLYRLASTAL
jgi:nicotinate-nucleotide adenylyltransferase